MACSKQQTQFEACERYFAYISEVSSRRYYKKAVLQMLSSAKSALANADRMTEEMSKTMPQVAIAAAKISAAADNSVDAIKNIGDVAKHASGVLERLESAFTPVKILWGDYDLVSVMMKIARIFANLAMARKNCMLASLLLNVCSEFGSEVVTMIRNWLFTPCDIQMRWKKAKQQGIDLSGITAFAEMQNWLAHNTAITVSSLAVVIFGILQFSLGLPKMTNPDAMLKFFGDRSRNMKNMVDFAKSSWNIFTDVAEWIIAQVFPGMVNHNLDEYIVGYSRWAKEVLDLVDPKNPVCERVKTEKALIYKISKLYKKGMGYSATLSTLKVKDDLRDHFQKTFKIIESFLKEADHSGALGNTPRVKPYMIHLFGESGVGKSGMLWPLCSDLNAALCSSEEEAQDIASETYFRSAEQEFWDGYAGQNICVWDDFGQLADSTANPNPEYFEIIRAGNAAPYPLHMATLTEKSRTKFISKFCILTSNKISQKVSSIVFPAAYRRRIDLLCKVDIKDEFAKEGYDNETQQTVRRLDTSKCASGVDTRVYEFTVYDPESLQPLYDGEEEKTRKMSYEQLVEHVLRGASVNFGSSINFNESIAERMDKNRFQKMKDLIKHNPFVETKIVREKKVDQETEVALEKNDNQKPKEVQETEVGYDTVDEIEMENVLDWKPAQEQMANSESEYQDAVSEVDEISVDAIEEEFAVRVTPEEMKAALEAAPLRKEQLLNWREKAKSWLTIKNVLIGIGVIFGGLGVFGLFRYFMKDDDEQLLSMPIPEGFTSGDAKTTHVKRLVAEASVSGDSQTAHLKRAQVEAIDVSASKTVSRVLRHELVSDDGWIDISVLLEHISSKNIDRASLFKIVSEDPKKRFEIDIPKDKIRAVQGHSFMVDPEKMYKTSTCHEVTHFTYGARINSIKKLGIKRMNRAFVHLHPGHITVPPQNLPNRNVAIHLNIVDMKKWETPNGYILSEDIPPECIKRIIRLDAKTEASVSGDCRTKNLPRVVTEGIEFTDAHLEAWKDKSAQELITHRILGNLYRIYIDGAEILNGLFVRDTVMLTVEHLLTTLREGKMITIENIYGAEFTVPIKELQYLPILDSQGGSKDALLIKFPRHVNCHSDIVKHFQKMPELAVRRADVCLPTISTVNGKRMLKILGNADCKIDHAYLQIGEERKQIRDALHYNLNTTYGDCGSPVIVNDVTFLRKIAGIHVAAYEDGSAALGQSVTQNDLISHLAKLGTISLDHDDLPNVSFKNACLQHNVSYSSNELITMLDMPAETFGYIGQCSRVSSPPLKTDLRPSAIHGYVKPTTKPAILRHHEVNMIHKNMEKCAINCPHIPQQEIDRAVCEVKALLLSGKSRSRLARVLTYEEAVSGSPISDYIDGIKRQSSPGYPHVFNKKAEFPGKTTWFGKDDWVYSEEIRKLVEERLQWAREGRRYPTVWSDTLKDERRPIEKVNALKTRVFAHGPMDYTIAFRMYFLGFIAHIMENRIENEQSLGTNPFGMDWKITAKKLQRFGHRVFAGDFSQFDGTLNSGIMKEFASVANAFYNDGSENALIREVLMVEIFNSIHLCSGKFIQLTHSQPSGNPLTTVLNSFYNSVSMRIAYYRCFGENAPAFSENVSMVSYGDDNVINFSAAVEDKFNQNTVTSAYQSFGMIYTDEAKTSGKVAPWRRLDEVNYLKRQFREEDGMWRAPLALETILESLNWVRKCPDELEACVQNCETAFRELAQHPQSVFDSNTKLIAESLFERTNRYPVIKPRLVYLEDDSPAW